MRQDSGPGRAASIPCGQPLVPTDPQGHCRGFFESYPSSWSPVTESNRRPSSYHASRHRLVTSHEVALLEVGGISVSGQVALSLWLSGAVVTWFVAGSGDPSPRIHPLPVMQRPSRPLSLLILDGATWSWASEGTAYVRL